MEMTTTNLSTIMTSLTGVIDVSTIISFLATIIPIAAAFVLMWFGVRKAISAVMGAIRGGSLGV